MKHVMKQVIIESQKNCENIIIIDADTEYTEVETNLEAKDNKSIDSFAPLNISFLEQMIEQNVAVRNEGEFMWFQWFHSRDAPIKN